MSVSITLNHKLDRTKKGTVKLELTTVAYGISSKVFAIEVIPGSADPQNPYYRFSHVCSPSELVEFPEDTPRDNCYFRTDSIQMIFDSDELVPHVMENMRHDIANLVHEYNELDNASDTFTGSNTFS